MYAGDKFGQVGWRLKQTLLCKVLLRHPVPFVCTVSLPFCCSVISMDVCKGVL